MECHLQWKQPEDMERFIRPFIDVKNVESSSSVTKEMEVVTVEKHGWSVFERLKNILR